MARSTPRATPTVPSANRACFLPPPSSLPHTRFLHTPPPAPIRPHGAGMGCSSGQCRAPAPAATLRQCRCAHASGLLSVTRSGPRTAATASPLERTAATASPLERRAQACAVAAHPYTPSHPHTHTHTHSRPKMHGWGCPPPAPIRPQSTGMGCSSERCSAPPPPAATVRQWRCAHASGLPTVTHFTPVDAKASALTGMAS